MEIRSHTETVNWHMLRELILEHLREKFSSTHTIGAFVNIITMGPKNDHYTALNINILDSEIYISCMKLGRGTACFPARPYILLIADDRLLEKMDIEITRLLET